MIFRLLYTRQILSLLVSPRQPQKSELALTRLVSETHREQSQRYGAATRCKVDPQQIPPQETWTNDKTTTR